MGHADPENEVSDIPSPEAGAVRSPDTDAGADHVENADSTNGSESSGDRDADEPPEGGVPLHNGAYGVRHPERAAIIQHLWWAGDRSKSGSWLMGCHRTLGSQRALDGYLCGGCGHAR